MNTSLLRLALAFTLMLALVEPRVFAQGGGRGNPPAQGAAADRVPVRCDIVITRFEGDRQISRLSYTLSAAMTLQSSFRSGNRVGFGATPAGENKATNATQFVDVGTNIDVTVNPVEGGRYRVQMTFTESSVVEGSLVPMRGAVPEATTFRNFSYNSSAIMKNGETRQLVAGAEKATGQIVKLELTLTVEE